MPDAAPAPAFPDYRFAPNLGGHPDVYEIENRALDRAGHVLDAMRALAPWAGQTIVDLGCGTGFWLPKYAGEAARVIGIEPDPAARARAEAAARDLPGTEVAADVDEWWRARGASRHEVRSEWRFARRADLAAVLGIEFPARVSRDWLARHPAATGLTYGYVLFAVRA